MTVGLAPAITAKLQYQSCGRTKLVTCTYDIHQLLLLMSQESMLLPIKMITHVISFIQVCELCMATIPYLSPDNISNDGRFTAWYWLRDVPVVLQPCTDTAVYTRQYLTTALTVDLVSVCL